MIQMGNIISIDDLIESKRIKEETYQKCIEKLELKDEQIEPFQIGRASCRERVSA